MPKTNLRIDVLGTSFSIAAEEDTEYLNRLMERYQLAVESTQKNTGLKDPLKIAILTGFLVCDELQRVYDRQAADQELGEHEDRETEAITAKLIARIDEILKPESKH
jgi:cell division protein ZapA (FtsZ GTPase activity inhibitor)